MRCLRLLWLGVLAGALAHDATFPRPLPQQVVLEGAMLAAIVGGVAAATVDVPFPEDFFKPSSTAKGGANVEWNRRGNRCMYNCTGEESVGFPSNVGFAATARIVFTRVDPPPAAFLEVLSDGRVHARTEATLAPAEGDSSSHVRRAALKTRCRRLRCRSNHSIPCADHGDCPNGDVCDFEMFCTNDTGCGRDECVTCSQELCQVNNTTNIAPCVSTCVGGSDDGKVCPYDPACGGRGRCTSSIRGRAHTCYLLAQCAAGSGGLCSGNAAIQDCTLTGTAAGGAEGSEIFGRVDGAPFHAATARVVVGDTVIATKERTYRMVIGDSDNPGEVCSTNCAGVPETAPAANPPPDCE